MKQDPKPNPKTKSNDIRIDFIIEKLNKIEKKIAASGSDTSRITPNPTKLTEEQLSYLLESFNNALDLFYFCGRKRAQNQFFEDFNKIMSLEGSVNTECGIECQRGCTEFCKNHEDLQANGENPKNEKEDNPVPPLDKFIKIYEDHLTRASEGHDPYLLKKELFEELNLSGLTTDKENPIKIEMVDVGVFKISKYLVTQAQWKQIMGDNPSFFKGDDLPVENVSWDDAQEFIKKLNEKTGLKYRLPNEAEWIYAVRKGDKSQNYLYSGSNILADVGWSYENSNKQTHPVGQKKPNDLGLYDMTGNVWEWCGDDWHEDYYNAPEDGSAWIEKPERGVFRVLRGGSWANTAQVCRVSNRTCEYPDHRFDSVGFRLAI